MNQITSVLNLFNLSETGLFQTCELVIYTARFSARRNVCKMSLTCSLVPYSSPARIKRLPTTLYCATILKGFKTITIINHL